jgi:hypothetical protein
MAVIRSTSIEIESSRSFQNLAIRPLGETVRKAQCGTKTFSAPGSNIWKGTNGNPCQHSFDSVAAIAGQDSPAPVSSISGCRGGEIGIIASVTRPFCSDCSRLRLAADGSLLTCLFSPQEWRRRYPEQTRTAQSQGHGGGGRPWPDAGEE